MAELPPIVVEGEAPTPAPVAPAAPAGLVAPAPGKVAIRDTDGTVSLIAEGDLTAAANEGARPATDVEYYAAKTGAAGQVMSAVTGATRGASFGLSDPLSIEASRALGGDQGADEMRRTLNLLREANPNASLGGEIAGSLAGMALIPGGAAAGEVRGAGVAARALERVAQVAPRALLEGGALGVGQQWSEDALGDHEAVAENYLAAGLKGGFANLLIGGGLHVAGGATKDAASTIYGRLTRPSSGGALTQVSGKTIEALVERELGAATPGVGEKIRKHLVKLSAGLSGTQEEVVEKLSRMTPEAQRARRIAVFDSEKEIQAATSEFRRAGDEMLTANKLTMEEFRGELKAEKIAKAVRTGNEGDVAAYTRATLQRAIEVAESELSHASGVAPQAVKSLEGIARSAYEGLGKLEAAIASGKDINVASFMALDVVKRDTQRWVSGGYNSIGRIADPIESRLAQRSVQTLDGYQKQLISGLEDSELWGRAGDVQKAINADWTIQIDASKRFHNALTTEIGRDPSNPFIYRRGIDPGKADAYGRNLLNPNADLTHQAVRDYVDSTERLAKTLREHVELPAEKMAEVERTMAAAQRFRSAVDKAEETLTITNQFKSLTGKNDGFATLAGMVGLSTGPVGAVAGAALGSLANPGRVVAQMAALERMGAKLDEKFQGGLSSFLSGKSAPKLARAGAGGTDEAIRSVRNGAQAHAALAARAAAAFRGLGESTPKVARAATATVMRAASYIGRIAPRDPAPAGAAPFVQQTQRPFKPSERAKAQAAIEVLDDPTVVIDALNEGRLSRNHIEAMKVIYPKMYERTRAMIQEMAREGTPKLTIQKEVGLSVLFDTPVNAMMQPQNIRGFTAAFAQGADPQGGEAGGQSPSRPLGKSSGAASTEFDRLEAPA